jgi:mono/diheme cytochrome c family protein
MHPRTALLLAAVAVAALATVGSFAFAAGAAVPGNPTRGKALFIRPGLFCGSCHTLKAAGSKGRDGANLDKAKPGYARIVEFVTKGSKQTPRWPAGMPAYGGRHAELTKAEMQDIAAFVYDATHR